MGLAVVCTAACVGLVIGLVVGISGFPEGMAIGAVVGGVVFGAVGLLGYIIFFHGRQILARCRGREYVQVP